MTRDNFDKYNYSIGEGFNFHLTKLTYKILSKFFTGSSCLEIGCADGYGTEELLKYFNKVTAVDASKKMVDKLQSWLSSPDLKVINSYIEDLNLIEKYDTIFMSHTLDTVDNPQVALTSLKKFAHAKSKIIIEVPNAYSIHRQAGVLMGLLSEEHDFNETDKSVGHKRIYDLKSLTTEIKKSGMSIINTGGFMLKPLPNSKMQELIGHDLNSIDAYSKLGGKYPELAAEIYVVCKIT